MRSPDRRSDNIRERFNVEALFDYDVEPPRNNLFHLPQYDIGYPTLIICASVCAGLQARRVTVCLCYYGIAMREGQLHVQTIVCCS